MLPLAGWARAFGRSSELRRNDSDVSTAMNDVPLNRNAQPVPTEAIMRPATAGPIMRAALNEVEFSAIAFESSASPTSSATKVWRTGASSAALQPNRKANI